MEAGRGGRSPLMHQVRDAGGLEFSGSSGGLSVQF